MGIGTSDGSDFGGAGHGLDGLVELKSAATKLKAWLEGDPHHRQP